LVEVWLKVLNKDIEVWKVCIYRFSI